MYKYNTQPLLITFEVIETYHREITNNSLFNIYIPHIYIKIKSTY